MKLKQLILLSMPVILSCCILHKKKKDYIIPESYPVEMKDELRSSIERGILVYKENCTGCHGIFAKGKDGVPDFSEKQIQKYSNRFLMQDPTSHAVAIQMHPTQLNDVLTYLRYRTMKNGQTDPSDK